MQQCGEEWKTAKANNATGGQTWPEFLKSCRTQKASAPAAAPAAAPAPAPAPVQTMSRSPLPAAPMKTAARPTGAGQFTTEYEAKARCPSDTVVWVNTKVAHLSLRRHALLRNDEAGRLYVRGRRQRRRRSRFEEPHRQEGRRAAIGPRDFGAASSEKGRAASSPGGRRRGGACFCASQVASPPCLPHRLSACGPLTNRLPRR